MFARHNSRKSLLANKCSNLEYKFLSKMSTSHLGLSKFNYISISFWYLLINIPMNQWFVQICDFIWCNLELKETLGGLVLWNQPSNRPFQKYIQRLKCKKYYLYRVIIPGFWMTNRLVLSLSGIQRTVLQLYATFLDCSYPKNKSRLRLFSCLNY